MIPTRDVVLGPLTRDELPGLRRLTGLGFGDLWSDEEWERASGLLEHDRSILGYRDGELAGHTSAYTLTMCVPAGRTMPVAGVTWVSVSPAHRRRGVLRTLMAAQLQHLAEHGEAVAALWASEPVIYGRFGFGEASRFYSTEVPRSGNALRPIAGSDEHRVSVQPLDETLQARCADLYTRLVLTRPGMVHRSGARSEAAFEDPPDQRHGATELRCVLITDRAGVDQAYALYQVKPGWAERSPSHAVRVREMMAATPAARHRLLRTVLDLDLTATTEIRLPVDDPLFDLLVDARRTKALMSDQLWVRLVDLPGALAARTYSVDVDVVLDVTDALLPANHGRWRLRGGPDGAEASATRASADLALDVRELGAAFLGEPSLAGGGRAGLVHELTPGSLAVTSRAFAHDPRPFITFVF